MSIARQKPSFSSNLSLRRWLTVSVLAVGGLFVEEGYRTSMDVAAKKSAQSVWVNKVSETDKVSNTLDHPRPTNDPSNNASPQSPAPLEGAEELQALHPTDRIALVTAALQQAARKSPDAAVFEAIRFCDLDPSYSLEYGRALLSTLARSHDFPAALRFVLAEESEGSLGENGNKWLNSLFNTWGQEEPRRATHAIDTLVSSGLRGEAMQAVAAGWAKTDPSGLADYVWKRPPAPEREFMLEVALRSWIEDDPVAAKSWMARHGRGE